jgi:hypothetical protein
MSKKYLLQPNKCEIIASKLRDASNKLHKFLNEIDISLILKFRLTKTSS